MDTTSETRVQVLFTIRENPGDSGFTDALYFKPDEFAALSPKDLNAAQQARYTAYKEMLLKPLPAVDPKEQAEFLIQQKSDLEAELMKITPEAVAAATALLAFDDAATAVVSNVSPIVVQPGKTGL